MQTRIGRCDKALEPAISETVKRKKLGKRLTKPERSMDITRKKKYAWTSFNNSLHDKLFIYMKYILVDVDLGI